MFSLTFILFFNFLLICYNLWSKKKNQFIVYLCLFYCFSIKTLWAVCLLKVYFTSYFHHISIFTPLHLSHSFSYKLLFTFWCYTRLCECRGFPLQVLIGLQVSLMSVISVTSMWRTNIRPEEPPAAQSICLQPGPGCSGWTNQHDAWTFFKVSFFFLLLMTETCFSFRWSNFVSWLLTGFLGSVCCCSAVQLVFLQLKEVSFFILRQQTLSYFLTRSAV